MPIVPKTIKVQVQVTQTIEPEVFLPFYYASISSFWIYFAIDIKTLKPYLKDTGLKPVDFDGKGLVNLNFQNYTAHNGNSLAQTNELEFNIVSYPEVRADEVPRFAAECFLKGEDQTKIMGHYRVHVPCDNKFAVAAGKALYGENKFFAAFDYEVPSLNLPTVNYWKYTIGEPNGPEIISLSKVDFHHLHPEMANPAAIINYSMLNSRLVGSRRNLWATVQNYFPLPAKDARNFKISIGKSKLANMTKDLEGILGKNKNGYVKALPIAVQVIQTPPVIAESRPYYAGY